MFDFHTHILPEIDDGSKNEAESLAMVEELTRQGVSGIAATPHFYADRSTPERFFWKREIAWEKLRPNLPPETPKIRLGAEVAYYEGIHRMEELEKFRLEGTSLLMVEMPVCKWTSRMIASLQEMNNRDTITVMLAHVERYRWCQNKAALEQLRRSGVLMQVSTGFFIQNKFAAMRMLKKGAVHFLGTDTHNMDERKPDYAQAVEIIRGAKGDQLLRGMVRRERAVLDETE